jgi:hypothetical protein
VRSDDARGTAVESGEPVSWVHHFSFEPASPGILYVETAGRGLLRSSSGGQ